MKPKAKALGYLIVLGLERASATVTALNAKGAKVLRKGREGVLMRSWR